MKNILKIAGYLSLILSGLILLNSDLIGAIPYIINAVLSFKYANKTYKNREFMIAYTVIMLLMNLLAVSEDGLAIFDVGAWLFFLYAWLIS